MYVIQNVKHAVATLISNARIRLTKARNKWHSATPPPMLTPQCVWIGVLLVISPSMVGVRLVALTIAWSVLLLTTAQSVILTSLLVKTVNV